MIFLIIVAVFVLVITSVCVTIYCNNHQKTLSYDLKDFNSIVGASGQITSDNAEEYGNCGENKYFLKDGIFVIRGSGSVDYEEIPIEAIKSDSENNKHNRKEFILRLCFIGKSLYTYFSISY